MRNFDGVHKGHQKLIEELLFWKSNQKVNVNCIAITFSPHPRELLLGSPQNYLHTLDQKITQLKHYGIDEVQVLNFTQEFSKFSAEKFLETIRVQKNPVSFIAVGENFHFGHNQQGNAEFLKQWCDQQSVDLKLVKAVKIENEIVSSSQIRKLILEANLKKAAQFLGRNFDYIGRVKEGNQQGRLLGFPTANLYPEANICLPPRGVYLTKTQIENESVIIPSVTNIGIKPTLGTGQPLCIETHLLGSSQNLYEKSIRVEFLDRLRDEKKFSSLEELRTQIQHDITHARKVFGLLK
jgi:riboflavin kinase/FMN adenylyltransferase